MLALDANIVVRFLTGDHREQSPKARELLDKNDVFVATTVVLECEWVLRSVYGYAPKQVCNALRAFAGLRRVHLENPRLLARAIDGAEQGMDFADALHLGSIGDCEAMMTFDRTSSKPPKQAASMMCASPDQPCRPGASWPVRATYSV